MFVRLFCQNLIQIQAVYLFVVAKLSIYNHFGNHEIRRKVPGIYTNYGFHPFKKTFNVKKKSGRLLSHARAVSRKRFLSANYFSYSTSCSVKSLLVFRLYFIFLILFLCDFLRFKIKLKILLYF